MSEQKREVVHDIYFHKRILHCLIQSPMGAGSSKKNLVSTCIKDALEWFDYLCASSTLSHSQTVRQCVYRTECLGTRLAPPLIHIHKVLVYTVNPTFSDFHATC